MFISLEGTEGVGKSTLIEKLADYYRLQGRDVVVTREPGGTPLSEKIRALLLDKNEESMGYHSELLLMYAARSQHIQQVILPAIQADKVVISDRFVDASFAYQCAGRGIERKYLDLLNEYFVPRLPDLTFWLDAPIEMGLQRAKHRGDLDRFEQEKVSFFERVQAGYAQLHQEYPHRIRRLDATQSKEQVFEEAVRWISTFSV